MRLKIFIIITAITVTAAAATFVTAAAAFIATAAAIAFLFKSAAAAASLFRAAFIYHNVSAANISAVQRFDGCFCFIIICHFNKAKAFAAVGKFV